MSNNFEKATSSADNPTEVLDDSEDLQRLGKDLAETLNLLAPYLIQDRDSDTKFALSPRMQEILHMVVEGAQSDTIARTLYLGESTVKTHLSDIFRRMYVKNRAEAADVARYSGLVNAASNDVAGEQVTGLSATERMVLSYVAQDLTNAEIGNFLCIAKNTVKTHLSSVYKKLDIRDRKEAKLLFNDPAEWARHSQEKREVLSVEVGDLLLRFNSRLLEVGVDGGT